MYAWPLRLPFPLQLGTYQLSESQAGPQGAGNGTATKCVFFPKAEDGVPVRPSVCVFVRACVCVRACTCVRV